MYLNNFPQELKETIKAEALNLGFCVVGFTTPDEMNDQVYQNWLSRKYYAGMTYLASEKTLATRKQPIIAFPA